MLRIVGKAFQENKRRGCAALKRDPWPQRYKPVWPSLAPLRQRIREIAEIRVRHGHLRIHVFLRREGWPISVKRVHRLYRTDGPNLRAKRPHRYVMSSGLRRHVPSWIPSLMRVQRQSFPVTYGGRCVHARMFGDSCLSVDKG